MATLVARSNDGSLIGIHPQDAASTSKSGLIRCYDGNVSNGSLKFTLRFPLSSSTNEVPSGVPASVEKKDELRKLVFASSGIATGNNGPPNFLCGMRQSSSSILVWDLDRGVLSKTVDVRDANNATAKKKKRKSSMITSGNEILCDIATSGNQLYALVFFPDEAGSSSFVGKCRLYQYDLSANEVTLVKKIKVGSVPAPSSASNEEGVAGSFAIAISKATVVVRMGHLLRVFDLTTSEKLCKMDIPGDAFSSNDEESDSLFAPLGITPDGRYIVTSSNNQAILFSYNKEDGDDEQNIQTMALLSSKDDSAIRYLDLTLADDELALVTFQPVARIASLFTISTKSSASSLVPLMPQAQLQTDENKPSLSFIHAGLHPRKPNESMLLLFQQAKHAGGSAAGSGTSLPMESLSYADESLEGTVTVGTSLSLDDADAKDKKKRKASNNVALAPGDQGREASLAMDLTHGKKKARVEQDEDAEEAKDEDEFEDMEEDGEQGQSIAERLALLSSAMEQTDEEDDEDDEDQEESKADGHKSEFKLKSATSETLTTLLTQALSSNDSSQLITALQVTDRRLVEGTVRALQALDAERGSKREASNDSTTDATTTGYIPTLMAHIVRRMARRHSLVMPLGVWVKAILAATARSSTNQVLHSHGDNSAVEEQMAKEGREMAMKLGPLKNFLNERVECFPQLLRLEGRLALLNQQL